MSFELLVDGPNFRDRLLEDLEEATERAWIASMCFESDDAGRPIARELARADVPDRRVLADELFSTAMINDEFLYRPDNWFDRELWEERRATQAMLERLADEGVEVRLAQPPGPVLERFLQRAHKKLVVVDDAAYVGGMNLAEHNFRWHDLMVRVEEPELVDAFARDFQASWTGDPLSGQTRAGRHRVTSLDGHENPSALEPLRQRIQAAEDSVRVVSPYLSPPFLEPIRTARDQGAEVELLTPDANNWPLFRTVTLDEARRHDYEVHLYPERMNHTKAMVLDDETLVVGSSNFDLFSYWLHEEIVLEIEDPEVVDAFHDQVLDPDRQDSRSPDDWPAPPRGQLARAGLHSVYRTVQGLAPLSRWGARVRSLDA